MLCCWRAPIRLKFRTTSKDDHQDENDGPQADYGDSNLRQDVEKASFVSDKDPAVEEDNAGLDQAVAYHE